MITNKNIVLISQIRKNAEMVMHKIDKSDQPLYLFSRSKIKAVMLNPEKFAQMQEMIENYLDQQTLLSVDKGEMAKAEDWNKVKIKSKK